MILYKRSITSILLTTVVKNVIVTPNLKFGWKMLINAFVTKLIGCTCLFLWTLFSSLLWLYSIVYRNNAFQLRTNVVSFLHKWKSSFLRCNRCLVVTFVSFKTVDNHQIHYHWLITFETLMQPALTNSRIQNYPLPWIIYFWRAKSR